jgi:putative toxin-antitoxin system antitoxin component (TIGR02293 family)
MSGATRAKSATSVEPAAIALSEVANKLEVPQHVLKFWETKFAEIRPIRRTGGRRYYRPEDVDLLRAIRGLLYDKGYTVRGVQKLIREGGLKVPEDTGRSPTSRPGRTRIGKEAQRTLAALMSTEPALRMALIEQIRQGFQFKLVEELAKLAGVELSELVDLGVIPRRTLAHSKLNQQFSPAQSDRATRFFRLFQRAKDTFGSDEKAMSWLKRPTKPLQQNAPMDLLDTEEGARVVEDLLTRIDYGIAA